jgi:hypothetical protein
MPNPVRVRAVWRARILAAALVVTLVAGCSSGGSGSDANNASGLKAAAGTLSHALLTGDAKTYHSFLTGKCAHLLSEHGLMGAMSPSQWRRSGYSGYQVTVRSARHGQGDVLIELTADGAKPPTATGEAKLMFTDGRWRLHGNDCLIAFLSPATCAPVTFASPPTEPSC